LSASPLMVGGDLPTMDDYSLALITNADVIACNQNGVMGRLVYNQDHIESWLVEQRDKLGSGWVGVFNRSDQTQHLDVTHALLGLKSDGRYRLREVWRNQPLALRSPQQTTHLTTPPNGVLFLRYEAEGP
jgi:alpha-galactosidase